MTPAASPRDAWTRRRFLRAAGAFAAAPIAARLAESRAAIRFPSARAAPIRSDASPATAVTLRSAPTTVDLGGRLVQTWAYGDEVPGPLVRVHAGSSIVAVVENQLPKPTSVHWHGIAVPFDMDGVPGVTQDPIAPGASFTYRFTPTVPGTYFFHPHVGLQLDRALYGPLVVDDPSLCVILCRPSGVRTQPSRHRNGVRP